MVVHFAEWYKDICTSLKKNGNLAKIENEFINQKSDEGRIVVLLKVDEIINSFIEKCFQAKDNRKSEQFRKTGNKLYGNNSLNDALRVYTESISFGNANSQTLALSYANRSAVLYALNEYELCKEDIRFAFDNGYPEDLHYKLYERLGRCYFEKGDYLKAKENFEISLQKLSVSALDKGKKNDKAKKLIPFISKCNDIKCVGQVTTTKNHMYFPNLPEIPKDDKNLVYLCASKSFSIKSNEKNGRFAVAAQDISAGEIIIIEKPYSSICLPECYKTHCYNCLSRFKVSYPCRQCASVQYCSISCENKSWGTFHEYECFFLNLLITDDIGLGHLAMKVVVRDGLKALMNFSSRPQTLTGVNESGIFDPDDYLCLYSLVGNSTLRKHDDLFRRSLVAIFLAKILQNSDFFSDSTLSSSEKNLIVVASHLLKQIQMLPCNAHEISEGQMITKDLAENELREIGSAAYTTLSLLNHSCDPSVVRHCYGDVCVLRALKHIRKGEEIADNYGFLYAVQGKKERMQHLSEQYYFQCQCTPCKQNWPLYQQLTAKSAIFTCTECNSLLNESECPKCRKADNEIAKFIKNKTEENFQQAMTDVLNHKDVKSNLQVMLSYLDLMTRRTELPYLHVNNCQELVKLCFSLEANFVWLQ